MSNGIGIIGFILKNNYEGNEIPFRIDENGEVFMNATVMAKPFKGKKVNDFLRNKSPIAFIDALQEQKTETGIPASADSKLVITQKGGNDKNDQGTWFQRNLALEFARW